MKKEDWRKARAGVKKFRSRDDLNRFAVCRYAVENKDGQQHVFYQDYCHAGLSRWGMNDAFRTLGGKDKFDPVAVINLLCEPRAGEDTARRFYEWLFNFSPFANVFVTKSVKQAMRENVIVVSPEHPGNMMVGGLIASRLVSEDYSHNGNYRNGWLWDQLVQQGVHPSVAFNVAHIIKPTGDYQHVIIDPMHHGVLTGMSHLADLDKTLWKFLDGKPVDFGFEPWAKDPTYSNIYNTWRSPTNRFDGHNAVKTAMDVVKKKGMEKNNPFAKRAINLVGCNEFIEEVSPRLRALTQKENAIAA